MVPFVSADYDNASKPFYLVVVNISIAAVRPINFWVNHTSSQQITWVIQF